MKAAVAFNVGLWTGALAIGAASLVYFYGNRNSGADVAVPDQTETRVQLLQQQNAQSAAEIQRLRETVVDLQGQLAAVPPFPASARRVPFHKAAGLPVADWIVQSVQAGDPQALPKLEQAALQNNADALDAVALLADRDNAETLTRLWSAAELSATSRNRATQLMAATVELNPRGEELLQPLAANEALLVTALRGVEAPDFNSRVALYPGVPRPPHFKPDYALRLRLVESWRTTVTNEMLVSAIDQTRSHLMQQIGRMESAAQ